MNALREEFERKLLMTDNASNGGIDVQEEFERRLQILNEEAGRGRGIQVGNQLKNSWEDAMKTISYDYLNRSTHHFFKEEKYNFNNYYSLDIRIKIDDLLRMWTAGTATYESIFEKIYANHPEFEKNLLFKLRRMYELAFEEEEGKKALKNAPVSMPPLHKENHVWQSLDGARRNKGVEHLYSQMPVVSIHRSLIEKNGYLVESGQEGLAIKKEEFVGLIMSGLESAARGHVPQGVTIEEILEGKFSRKAITPEQGTFINRVKDPTSDKDFDFRAWSTGTLEMLHGIIMDTFKRDKSLDIPIPNSENSIQGEPVQNEAVENTSGLSDPNASAEYTNDAQSVDTGMDGNIKRSSLLLYMAQDAFNRLEKGGKGFSNTAKGILNHIDKVAETPDF